ncbi:hypothetical protein [Rhodococcus sp. IC4_135]|uniref:hypothetical protein n=1 Tax=Rhodococcus sp. IC4_135 TaxID=2715537 RepID=UPI001F10048E
MRITPVTLSGLGDRGCRSPRLLIGGHQIQPVTDHTLPADERADFAVRGLSAPTLYELAPADAGVYREQMLELAHKNSHASSVHVYDEAEYRQMRLLVSDDGKAGVATKDDEMSPHSGTRTVHIRRPCSRCSARPRG